MAQFMPWLTVVLTAGLKFVGKSEATPASTFASITDGVIAILENSRVYLS
jgi:hypothetical protein